MEKMKQVPVTDSDLSEINSMLDWFAGTELPDGRILGKLGVREGKRANPQSIPDRRITKLNDRLQLLNKRVLEVGCFEGIHTLGLRMFCNDVTAIDIRPVNVVKTLARLSYHGSSAKVHQYDVEKLDKSFGHFDLLFHCGVLYHLMDPVEHIFSIADICEGIFLDTHVARDEKKIESRKFQGIPYDGAYHHEGGWADPFSGKDPKAFWLTYSSLENVLRSAGFNHIELLEDRAERNGPRVAIYAHH